MVDKAVLAPWQGEAAAARTAIERYAENQALGQPVAAGLTRPQHQALQALFGDPALYTRDRTLNALRLKQSRNQPLLQSRPLDRLSQLRLLDPDLAPVRAPRDERQFRPEEGNEPSLPPLPDPGSTAAVPPKAKGMTVADLMAKRAAAKREAMAKRVLHPHEEKVMHLLNRERGYTLSPAEHGGEEFRDSQGRSYDLVGGQDRISEVYSVKKFTNSIASHTLKSNDFTIVFVRGFSPQQKAEIFQFIQTLPEKKRKTVLWEE